MHRLQSLKIIAKYLNVDSKMIVCLQECFNNRGCVFPSKPDGFLVAEYLFVNTDGAAGSSLNLYN